MKEKMIAIKNKFLTFPKKNLWFLAIWIILITISKNIHLSTLVGHHKCHIAMLTATLPILGYFYAPLPALIFASLSWILTHTHSIAPITLGIPTILATLSWNYSSDPKSIKNGLIHLLLPLFCMILFFLSPVGSRAWPYSLFWLIPITLYLISLKKRGTLLTRALQSTFIAHATGSILWVYTIQMPAEAWISLIPVVAIERSLITAISSLSIVMVIACKKYITTSAYKKNYLNI